jgi:hypothetical protein
MKNTTILIKPPVKEMPYTSAEICPVCGVYTPEGDLCIDCQKKYDLYEPKSIYIEGVC